MNLPPLLWLSIPTSYGELLGPFSHLIQPSLLHYQRIWTTVNAVSLAPYDCTPDRFGPTSGTNLGIFPENDGLPGGTGQGTVANR